MPITLPVALIPMYGYMMSMIAQTADDDRVPNLPFFYLVFRGKLYLLNFYECFN
jgi:hypothetical protein